VTEGRGFSNSPGLRTGGKIFAERFDPGHGRRMKEWASVDAATQRIGTGS
jgi:hypothetical protein